MRSRTAVDVLSALDGWVEPVNNVVAADRGGDVRCRVAGRVRGVPTPTGVASYRRRTRLPPGDGWLERLPAHEEVPPTAPGRHGQRAARAESDAIRTDFAPPHRAERVRALLDGRTDLTPPTSPRSRRHPCCWAPVFQDPCGRSRPIQPGCATRSSPGTGAWTSTPPGAAAFAAWRRRSRRVAAQPVLRPGRNRDRHRPADRAVSAPWLTLAGVALALESLVGQVGPAGIGTCPRS